MNYTLQVHGERSLYRVPPGLYDLMSDISREVLRDQPDQLYKYIANYMDTLLKLRTNMNLAVEVVDDVIADNQELFAYVDDRGLTWEAANRHARVLQRAFRRVKARKDLQEMIRRDKEERLGKVPYVEQSPSFIAYFESLGIDYEKANRASLTIQNAFRTYMARKELRTMERCSTHTIDMVVPLKVLETPLVLDVSTARDSDLLVYQQSPLPSINSGWYKPTQVAERRTVGSLTVSHGLLQRRPGDSQLHVFEHSPTPSINSAWFRKHGQGSSTQSTEVRQIGLEKGMSVLGKETQVRPSPTHEARLPTYFDAASKVPMISENGTLEVAEEDVITLFSTDTTTSKSFIGTGSVHSQRVERQLSIKDVGKSSRTDSETGKELFGIIDKSSDIESFKDQSIRSVSKVEALSVGRGRMGSQTSRHTPLAEAHSLRSKAPSIVPKASQASETGVSVRPRMSSRMLKLQVKHSPDSVHSPPPDPEQ